MSAPNVHPSPLPDPAAELATTSASQDTLGEFYQAGPGQTGEGLESAIPVFAEATAESTSRFERTKSFFRQQKMKLCVGATAASLAATIALDPMGDTKDRVMEAAPYVATGVVASEALWIGGAAMMLGAVGSKIKNPLKIKKSIPEIAEKANDSRLFKAGFAVNVAGALGDFVVLSAGVMTKLPPHSWGTLSFTLLDLGVTLGVRKAMLDGIHENAEHKQDIDIEGDQVI